MVEMTQYAAYVRVSTEDQDTARQESDVVKFIEQQDDVDSWDAFIDEGSGANDDRVEFKEFVAAVEEGEYDEVVMSEVSRLARRTATAADFIDTCVEQGVRIHLLDDMITEIRPDDPMSQFFAKFLSLWYEEERKQTIRRIKSGLREARSQGKWTKSAPAGFYREGGYLNVDLEEFIGIQQALEEVENGESYRQAAKTAPVSRPTLMDIHKDADRRRLYLNGETDDERIELALEAVDT